MAVHVAGLLFAPIDEAAAASNEIVAAVAGQRIFVTSVVLVSSAANTLTWQSSATALSGAMSFAANGGYALGDGGLPLMVTASGEALNLLCSAADQVSGHISYFLA